MSPDLKRPWVVEFHPEFSQDVRGLSDSVRREIYSLVGLLRMLGPQLGRPQVDTLNGSKYSNMKELRFRADNGAWRVAFAFDVNRRAILWLAATSLESHRISSTGI